MVLPAAAKERAVVRSVLVAGATLCLFLAVRNVVDASPIPFDLRIYRGAARTLLEGQPVYAARFGRPALPFTYPPFALLSMLPLALVSQAVATWTWTILSFAGLVASVGISLRAVDLPRSPTRVLAIAAVTAAVSQPVCSTIGLGQINLILLSLVLVDAFVVPARHRGWLTGAAAAIKLTPLVFVVWFVAVRDVRAARRSLLAFVACTAAAWALLPSASLTYWTKEAFDSGRIGPVASALNQSLRGEAFRLFGHVDAAQAAWLVAATGVVVAAAVAARRLWDAGMALASLSAVAIAGLLASPISWPHHWVWVVPAVIAGWAARRDHRALGWASLALAAVSCATPWRWGIPVVQDLLVVAGAVWLAAAFRTSRVPAPGRSQALASV